MKRWTGLIAVAAALALLAGAVTTVSLAQGKKAAPKAKAPKAPAENIEEVARAIEAAVESVKPSAKPAQPRKMLVFSVCRGFKHGSVPICKKAMEILGAKTGAFEAVVSDDLANFEPDRIRQFAAVCFNNTTQEVFLPPPDELKKMSAEEQKAAADRDARLKQSLLEYVKGGGGLVGIHAATDTFYKWPEFGEMMGGYFDGHPWRSGDTVTVKAEDGDHPVARAFKDKPLTIQEEIYQIKAPYSRENLRILLVLDTRKTDMNKQGIKRTDNDFAIAWVRGYGKGRVFYSALGHNTPIYTTSQVLQHFLDGIQFAMGDLPADTTPSAKRGQSALATPGATVTAAEGEWTVLFDGKDVDAWQKNPKWEVKDGTLTPGKKAGYLWTKEKFGDFVLEAEFKMDAGTNSGVFIRTGNPKDPVQTGMEIQVLDSAGKEQVDKHDCGALYDCLAPTKNAARKPGEWNTFVITCQGPMVTIELNGEKVLEADLDKWDTADKNPDGSPNKYKQAVKDFPREGYVGLQEHGKSVWFRNIRIKTLGK